MRKKQKDDPKSGTLVEMAHAALKKDIIAGFLRPGEKLRVEHLKQKYGVSSGTLREALTMLIADKLVEVEGQRGFTVALVSAEDLKDLCHIRILLEKEAIRESIEHGDDEWEASVVSSYHILSRATKAFSENPKDENLLAEWERRHREFHLSLISAAPSAWIRYFLDTAYQQYERYRHMFLEVAEEFYKDRDAAAEHEALLNAVLDRDADLAAKLIEEHLTLSINEWVGYFEKIGAFASSEDAAKVKKAG
ncbi:GntR family transcriptional regulator [Emcibacter nanhaiensis]|uniref:FCD domain-containing protein n=1 Tax=Emcibacter nanhaiensis TaxID=1505037 RepID=A0A501PVN5_9PROT|nr:GntR family transcriptional regulator [Emcibacter nanhaiensis]TPD63791.1 FCD domain-containing protein [Emcibacter nanhaiensis]